MTVTDNTECDGDKKGDSCSFTRSGTCKPNNSSDRHTSATGFAGKCYLNNKSANQSCTTSYGCDTYKDVTETIEIGVCDSGVKDGCESGDWEDGTDTTNYWKWSCNNDPKKASDNYSDKYVSCERKKSDGIGIAVTNPTTTTDTLTTQVCDEYKPVENSCTINFNGGTCGTPTGSCSKKTNLSAGSSTAEICEVSSPNKTRMPATSVAINGDCGSNPTHHNCVQGTLGTTNDTSAYWQWTCLGSNGGTNANCSEAKPCPPPKFPTQANCQSGLSTGQICIQETTGNQCWTRTSGSVCNTLVENSCTQGTFNDVTDGNCTSDATKQCSKWSCDLTSNGVTTSTNCELPKSGPQCGHIKNSCQPQGATHTALSDETINGKEYFRWECTYNQMTINTCKLEKTPQCTTHDDDPNIPVPSCTYCSCALGTCNNQNLTTVNGNYTWTCSFEGQTKNCHCPKPTCNKQNGEFDTEADCKKGPPVLVAGRACSQNAKSCWVQPSFCTGPDEYKTERDCMEQSIYNLGRQTACYQDQRTRCWIADEKPDGDLHCQPDEYDSRADCERFPSPLSSDQECYLVDNDGERHVLKDVLQLVVLVVLHQDAIAVNTNVNIVAWIHCLRISNAHWKTKQNAGNE